MQFRFRLLFSYGFSELTSSFFLSDFFCLKRDEKSVDFIFSSLFSSRFLARWSLVTSSISVLPMHAVTLLWFLCWILFFVFELLFGISQAKWWKRHLGQSFASPSFLHLLLADFLQPNTPQFPLFWGKSRKRRRKLTLLPSVIVTVVEDFWSTLGSQLSISPQKLEFL